jgi:very-short-patch-repair endonuclease
VQADFYWPAHGLIVETDGWEAHRTLAAFRADRAKDAALTAAGYKVLRFTWDVHDATILRRLNALLG